MREPAFWWRPAGIVSSLLSPFGACYGAIAARRMLREGARARVPVICVGNFTLGGAGKTPTAIAIAQIFKNAGEEVFFLSRGYGGRLAGPHRVNAHSDRAHEVGDEALLLARVAPAIVARDRAAGAELAQAQGASLIVMDDGLQNASLVKDFTLAVVDGRRGIGNGKIFPAGPLRAPLEAQLQRIDALLVIGEEVVSEASAARVIIAAAQARGLPVFHGKLVPDMHKLGDLKSRKLFAFAGIGNPEKFFVTASAAGLVIEKRKAFPDHHCFTPEEAAELILLAEHEGLALLTTEKDHARMSGDSLLTALSARAHVMPVKLMVSEEEKLRATLLAKVKRPR